MNTAAIFAAITALQKLMEFIEKEREVLKRRKELTPEREAELDARIREAIQHAPHWRPSNQG